MITPTAIRDGFLRSGAARSASCSIDKTLVERVPDPFLRGFAPTPRAKERRQ
jgi:hypothetical protein